MQTDVAWLLAWEPTNAHVERMHGRIEGAYLSCYRCSVIQYQGRTLEPSKTMMYGRPKSKPRYLCGECLFQDNV